jgi:hypothetical protein
MRPRILALELFAIFVCVVIVSPLVHQMNGLVPDYILIGPILYVDLSQVLTVVALCLREHPALLIELELLLQLAGILVELYMTALVCVTLCKEADAVSLAYYPPHPAIIVIIDLFVIVFIVLIHEHIMIVLGVQVVLLLL